LDSPLARDAAILEGLCHLKRERFAEAARRFRGVLHQSIPADVQGQVSVYLAEALVGAGQGKEAAAVYQQLILEQPETSSARLARFGLGWVAFQQGDYQESLERFKDYVRSLPSAARHQADLPWRGKSAAEAHAVMGQGALEATIPQLWFAQGRCLMEIGEYEQAAARFERLRREVPQHPLAIDAAMGIADVLERQNRVGPATVLLESILPATLTTMQRHHVHVKLGSLYLNAGEATKAAAQFDMVKEAAEPELKQAALNGLADAAAFLGHDDTAMQWYEAAMQVAPTSNKDFLRLVCNSGWNPNHYHKDGCEFTFIIPNRNFTAEEIGMLAGAGVTVEDIRKLLMFKKL
jgi:tetratricopeptide (TPR) repeat protein